MLLAIDTSNEWSGIAFWDADGLRAEATWYSGRQHTEQVPAQIDLLARNIGLGPHELSVIATATGPGSWSGLRSGMSLAKAIAVGRSLPVIGISTLDALAQIEHGREGGTLALIRLGRDRYAGARYRDIRGGRVQEDDIQAYTLAEISEIAAGMVMVGDIPPTLERISTAASPINRQRRAPYLAERAWARHMQHDYDDLVTLEPIYLGNPVR